MSAVMHWQPEPKETARCWADGSNPHQPTDCGRPPESDIGLCGYHYNQIFKPPPVPPVGESEGDDT